MKCLVHVWRTQHSDGGSFVLRLTPMAPVEMGTGLELFPTEGSLTRRLTEIGITRMRLETTLSNLRNRSTSMWSNYDVAEHAFYPNFSQPSANQNEQEL
jgi:hypothetical protein